MTNLMIFWTNGFHFFKGKIIYGLIYSSKWFYSRLFSHVVSWRRPVTKCFVHQRGYGLRDEVQRKTSLDLTLKNVIAFKARIQISRERSKVVNHSATGRLCSNGFYRFYLHNSSVVTTPPPPQTQQTLHNISHCDIVNHKKNWNTSRLFRLTTL